MVNKKQVLAGVAGVAAAVTGAAAAQASDLPSKSSPKAPAPSAGDWAGVYAGASLNYDSAVTTYYDTDYDMNDFGVGAFVGYNHQMGNTVVGIELAANLGTATNYDSYNYSLDSTVDLKAKFGVDVNGILVYALAGGSYTRAGTYGYYDYNDFGINVGGGAAMKVTKDISVGAEYVYRLSQRSYEQSDYEGMEVNSGTLSLRAAYHF